MGNVVRPPNPCITGHPITSGLVIDVPYHEERDDLITNLRQTGIPGTFIGGTPTRIATPLGRAPDQASPIAHRFRNVTGTTFGTEVSAEALFSIDTLHNYDPLVSDWNETGNLRSFIMVVFLDGSILFYTSMSGDGSDNNSSSSAAGVVVAGQVHHAIATKSGTLEKVYLDGALVASSTSPYGSLYAVPPNHDIRIGHTTQFGGGEYFHDGPMIAARIWNRCLAPQEVSALFVDPWCIYRMPQRAMGKVPAAAGGDAVPQCWAQYRRRTG